MKKNTLRLIFTSTTKGILEIEEEIGSHEESNIIHNVSATSSVDSLPIIALDLKPNSKVPNLISISTGDEVVAYADKMMIFKGFLSSVRLKVERERVDMSLNGVSSFLRLQTTYLSYEDFQIKIGFREVFNEIAKLCNINETIIISESIPNDFVLTPIKSFSALSLINAICYRFDWVYDFNIGDRMSVFSRQERLDEIRNRTPYDLDATNIISSDFEQ